MHIAHATEIWAAFPELVPGVVVAEGISSGADAGTHVERLKAEAASRLAGRSEAELPEIQAWRRAFARMALKPTQYRCAAEALLRRFRREGTLPAIHPLVDLCNALSLAFAIPVAVFDLAKTADFLEVRRATGAEVFETFSGATEHPFPGEIVFVDAAARAHARRWTNRQSGYSAVRNETAEVAIVAEAMHSGARADIDRLLAEAAAGLDALAAQATATAVLTADSPRVDFDG